QIDYDGTFEYSPEVEVVVEMVETFALSAAYPNPFNPQTSFTVAVAQPQAVTIEVYNVLGRRVAVRFEGEMSADRTRTLVWEAGDRPSGLYFIRAVGERFNETRQVTLVKCCS
ncbi:MAG TPA: T9SS type A sorting domain-containing protein, partial [Rhodothermales bacterium]|nr:T9SS type A sorting domain-containing protein [Rhodothermales bacterium]